MLWRKPSWIRPYPHSFGARFNPNNSAALSAKGAATHTTSVPFDEQSSIELFFSGHRNTRASLGSKLWCVPSTHQCVYTFIINGVTARLLVKWCRSSGWPPNTPLTSSSLASYALDGIYLSYCNMLPVVSVLRATQIFISSTDKRTLFITSDRIGAIEWSLYCHLDHTSKVGSSMVNRSILHTVRSMLLMKLFPCLLVIRRYCILECCQFHGWLVG